jgi:hypothetical protein
MQHKPNSKIKALSWIKQYETLIVDSETAKTNNARNQQNKHTNQLTKKWNRDRISFYTDWRARSESE